MKFICIVLLAINALLFSLSTQVAFSQNVRFHSEKVYSIKNQDGNVPLLGTINSGILSNDLHIYLADNSNRQIHHFDHDGTYIRSFGREGRGPGEFLQAAGLTLSDDQRILYVLDYRNARIVGFDVLNGEHSHAIAFQHTVGSPLNQLFSFQNNLMLLGNYAQEDMMIHLIDQSGAVRESFGKFIDFKSFVHSLNDKQQLSMLHASKLDSIMLVGIAAPNRMKVFNAKFNIINELEDNLLPTPWETHMVMQPGKYETTFYSMAINNQLLSNETFLFHWLQIANPNSLATERFLELRDLRDGSILHSMNLDGMTILAYARESDRVIYLLTCSKSYDYEVYKLTIEM